MDGDFEPTSILKDSIAVYLSLIFYICFFTRLLTMVDLVCRKSREATELAISMVLFLSTEDAVTVVISIGEDNAIAVSVSVH